MNTRTITVSSKAKAKLIKAGVVVSTGTNLPPHLAKFFDDRAQMFDMHEVTVNLDKYDDFHPIHATV